MQGENYLMCVAALYPIPILDRTGKYVVSQYYYIIIFAHALPIHVYIA